MQTDKCANYLNERDYTFMLSSYGYNMKRVVFILYESTND